MQALPGIFGSLIIPILGKKVKENCENCEKWKNFSEKMNVFGEKMRLYCCEQTIREH